ncbi:hypothetical protein [Roseivirga sp. UBA838]|uniref:hypothetical protein n=1 Tax=Roseivirga sp. UBA838 TaxID=1947393 RepID=UPI00257CA05D|nr:hypothetical protein [Roseivirga sp. UBA838]|tara:strand:- start:17940 stop:18527 length:588 start_codon:yes stop_codon:yes gene_type:complete
MAVKIDLRKAGFEFFSIVVAVVLAMTLTEWRQDYLNKKLAQQSLLNIIEEVQENRRELMEDSAKISQDIAFIDRWLQAQNNASNEDFGVHFSFSFLSKSALEVAKINNSLTYLPNEVNMQIAEVYAAQNFYSDNAIKLFDIMGAMGRAESKENAEAFADKARQLRFHLGLIHNTIKAYLGESQQFLENHRAIPTS